MLLLLEFALLLEVEGDVIREEGFADAEALVDERLRRLELSHELRPHHVLLDDCTQSLIVNILEQ